MKHSQLAPMHIPTDLPGVVLFKERESSHAYRVWHDDWYAFCVVTGGAAEVRYRRRCLSLEANAVVAFAPGEVHETRRIQAPGSYWVLMVPSQVLNARAERLGRKELQLLPAPYRDPELFHQFVTFCTHLEQAPRGGVERSLLYEALLDRMLSMDARGSANELTAPFEVSAAVVRKVRDYLVEHSANERQSLTQIADVLGWSPAYISRAFSSEGFCPPQTLLRLIRVERGRRLLQATQSVKQAAYDAGFSSPEKFNQHFRTVWNLSPSAYLSRLS